jgi:amino acid transporter
MVSASNIATTANSDDQAIIEAGYKPQLKRSLGYFSSFAVSFSFMSVLMGVFANYGFLLTKAGPFGIWTWPLVGAGQTLVSLVFAEMASRVPLTGALYNWNIRLANPTIGWLTAWMIFFAYCLGYVGVVVAIFAPLQTFLGVGFGPNKVRVIGVSIFISLAVINIYGVRLAAHANKLAVIGEIVALFVFGGLILAIILINGEANTALITSVPATPAPYLTGFLMASLLAAWTIFGFESPSDLSEETVNAKRITPKSIVSSVVITTAIGWAFLTILTLAIPDVAGVTAAADPVSAIISYHLGNALTKVFLAFVLIALYASSLIGVTAASRILFAVARDKRIAGSGLFARVSAHYVPKLAIVVVVSVQILSFLLFQNASDLYASPTILLTAAYLITVVSFALGIKKLPPAQCFSLGRWHGTVVVLALVWLVSELGILTLPEEFHSAAYIAGGILVAGVVVYFVTILLQRTKT